MLQAGSTTEPGWLDLLEMRNAASHTYREALARDIYRRIAAHLPMLKSALQQLKLRLPV